jgi:glycosyltransferase involved in cell wall biosynthesis
MMPGYRAAFSVKEPLVTICIATYNRGPLLIERSVKSALAQTYRNIEVIVVGDHCTDETASLIAQIHDPRLRFINLPQRGDYPTNPTHRWMVAGSTPMNRALREAQGEWITHLDDDDEHMPDRVEKLLAFVQERKLDLAFHPFEWEMADGTWTVNEASELRYSQVSTSSIFYHRWLKRIEWDLLAWKVELPGDWHRLHRMKWLGVHAERYPTSLLRHYREGNQKKGNATAELSGERSAYEDGLSHIALPQSGLPIVL